MPAIATIFEHSNYSGRALQLQGVGDYDYATLGSHSFNDLTSSIKIESGYYLQAFTDAGFKGASAIFTGSSSYVGDGFNDKISSLRLVRGTPTNFSTVDNSNYGAAYRQPSPTTALATIYEHTNYSGRSLRLNGVGDYDYATLGSHSFNDLTSSIKIESGYYLQAYTDAGFKGESAIFTGSSSYVGDGFNDKISSLRLVRGTPNSSSAIDHSSYGAAYRTKTKPSPAPGPDIITGQPINKISSPVQPGGHQVPQGVWNKAGFVLGVTWKDPITGKAVKEDVIGLGSGSYITHNSNSRPYNADLWIWGEDVAKVGTFLGISAIPGGAGIIAASKPITVIATLAAGGLSGGILAMGPNWILENVTPSTGGINQGKHLDVWGTMFNPHTGPGGPVSLNQALTIRVPNPFG